MRHLLKSVGFGIICTAVFVTVAYGFATLINYCEKFGTNYALIPVLILVCIVLSTVYYYGSK